MASDAPARATACKEQLRRMQASIAEAEVHLAVSRMIIVDTIEALELLGRIERERSTACALDNAALIARDRPPADSRVFNMPS